MKPILLLTIFLTVVLSGTHRAIALDGPTPVRTFGPTGLEIELQKDSTLKVTGVQYGSPADGKFTKGQIIQRINENPIPEGFWEHRQFLADLITQAEATDGKLTFSTSTGDVSIALPQLGAFSDTWPLDCPKTDKIVAANAALLRGLAEAGGLGKHSLTDALGILVLLSTGTEQDLETVRTIYQKRMATFDPQSIGHHSWHNGLQGIAACEYYLRSGDKSVMPLIDTICDFATRFQAHGSYYHWATAANSYGVVNATGTNMLTFMLLAKCCGAKVNDEALQKSLDFFYRFVGHGNNPYGDGRPESGPTDNGKNAQIALAMRIAAKADNGKVYAMASDKCAHFTLYNYRAMLNGHTGPIGNLWFSPAASLLIDKNPVLYRNRQNHVRWFYELSRLHDGSFVMSSCRGYDKPEFGCAVILGLTGPRKTLQITGAQRSKFGVPFTLPELPWGRPADLAFLSLEGSPSYRPLDPVPHIEFEKIATATEEQLRHSAGHPEQAFREAVAAAIRKGGHYDLIEELLGSDHPFDRHTACLAINQFEPFRVRFSKGWLSADSIDPSRFTQTMFDRLMSMVRDPDEAIWLIDQSLLALAAANSGQTKAHVESILPWLKKPEWWFHESAIQALSPVFKDPEYASRVLKEIAIAHGRMDHIKARSTVENLMSRNAQEMPAEARAIAASIFRNAYEETPKQSSQEGSMDLSPITSISLAGTIGTILEIDPTLAPEMAKLSAKRLSDLKPREVGIHLDALIDATGKLDANGRKQVAETLIRHFRPRIYEEFSDLLKQTSERSVKGIIDPLDKLLQIDRLVDPETGWKLLDTKPGGENQWQVASFEPKEQLDHGKMNRYRSVTLPVEFENWYQPGYAAKPDLWKIVRADISGRAPEKYRNQPYWKALPDQVGEVVLFRKNIEIDDLDQLLFRLVVYCRQGYRIYINGQLVAEVEVRSKNWQPRITFGGPGSKIAKALKKGSNTIAATTFLQYFKGREGDLEVYLEGLKQFPQEIAAY